MTFEWISNDGDSTAFIAIDNQRRFYLSAGTRALLDNPTALILGYDKVNKRIIAAKPNVVRAVNVKPYSFDKRWYSSARNFVAQAGIDTADLPLRFVFAGKDYADTPDGAYTFQLADYDAPDGGISK